MNVQTPERKANRAQDGDWLAPDRADLPFFGEDHQALTRHLSDWAKEAEGEIAEALDLPPPEAVRRLTRLLGQGGWFSLALKAPVDTRAICLIREAFAYRHDLLDYAFSIQILAALPLALWGSDMHRSEILPKLCSGEEIGAFALTERDSGSDISAIGLQAVETEGGFRLTGQKSWIANADIADQVVVLTRTGAGTGPLGLTLFVADSRSEACRIEPVELIAPRPFGDIAFDDFFVPADRLVGDKGMGLAVAIDTLERCRITVGAAANGFARRAVVEAAAHVLERRATGRRLADIPAVRGILTRMTAAMHLSQLTVTEAAWEMDRGGARKSPLSSLAKLHATEAAQGIVDQCVQLHGAAGLVAGSLPENLYRQIRSLRLYEGASEVQEDILSEAVIAGSLR